MSLVLDKLKQYNDALEGLLKELVIHYAARFREVEEVLKNEPVVQVARALLDEAKGGHAHLLAADIQGAVQEHTQKALLEVLTNHGPPQDVLDNVAKGILSPLAEPLPEVGPAAGSLTPEEVAHLELTHPELTTPPVEEAPEPSVADVQEAAAVPPPAEPPPAEPAPEEAAPAPETPAHAAP